MTLYKSLSAEKLQQRLKDFNLFDGRFRNGGLGVKFNDFTINCDFFEMSIDDEKVDFHFYIEEEHSSYDPDDGYDYWTNDVCIASIQFKKDKIFQLIVDWDNVHIIT